MVIAAFVVGASASVAAVALAGRHGSHSAQPLLVTRFVHTGTLSPYRPRVRGSVIGGRAVERAAAADAIRDFGPANRILQIEFVAPPAAFGLPPTASWVRVDVAAPDRPGSAFSIWESLLAVSAIADANRGAGATAVAGKTVRLVFPGGGTADVAETVNEPVGAAGDVAPSSAQALGAAIAAEARQEHLKVADQGSFDVADRPAVYAVLVTTDPVGFGRESSERMYALQRGILDAPFAAAGSYVEVRDSAGGVVEIGASASRLQQGVGWSNPALGLPSDLLAP